jgi:parvulin-like peptidyl-prolyl isomerase
VGAKSGRNKRGGRGGPKKATPQSGGRKGGSRAAQRFGLILFGVVFIALFVVFAVAQGLSGPSVPSGDVALVTNVPAEIGHISKADYEATLEQQEAQAQLKKPPKAGSKKAEELRTGVVGELLNTAAILGEAEEQNVKVTPKEIEAEIAKVKKESFKTEKAWQEFLKESHYTEKIVEEKIELQIISKKIQEKITKEAPPPTEAEIEAYYDKEKAAQYTKKPSRDVRVVVNEDKKEVEAAQKALEADNSEASWKKVTKKYSPTTEANAGLQKEISEEFLTEPLKKDIFSAETGELVGPVKQEKNYLLLEVVKLHRESVQPLAEVKTTISTQLTKEGQESFFNEWVVGFQAKWRARSYCASDYLIEQCANFKGSGHPSTAPAACYEAHPKKPPTGCPAPVVQNQPAVPGTVSLAEPEGKRKVQRPLPEATTKKGKAAAGAKGAAGAAEGAAGAEGHTPEEEAELEAAEKAAAEAAAKEASKSGSSETSKSGASKAGE